MKITPSKCPKCNEPPEKILETAIVEAYLIPEGYDPEDEEEVQADEDFEYDETMSSEVDWDTKMLIDENGKATVVCTNHHRWLVDVGD